MEKIPVAVLGAAGGTVLLTELCVAKGLVKDSAGIVDAEPELALA